MYFVYVGPWHVRQAEKLAEIYFTIPHPLFAWIFFIFTSHFTGFSLSDIFVMIRLLEGIMVFSGKLAMANKWQKKLPGVPM